MRSNKIEVLTTGNMSEETKQAIDYLSSTLVSKHNTAMMKRSIKLTAIDVIYKVSLVYIAMKYFPEIWGLFSK